MTEQVVIVKEFPYKPREVFKDYHKRTQRWSVLICHRRAGKTVACLADLLRRAIKDNKPDGRYAYVAPYMSQSKNIAWNYLLKFSEPAIVKKNESELWVELVNGSRIRLFGADNADALRGLYLDGIVLDEYADMRPKVWGEIIRPLLADRQGWATFIGTPKGHNNFWEIYQNALKSDNWYVKVLRASQTGLLAPEELEDAAKMMDESQYLQEFECDFESAIVGAFYGKELRTLTDEGRITRVPHDPEYKVFTSWDLGRTDSTAIWWWQVIRGEIRMLDYHSSNGQDVPYYAQLITDKAEDNGWEYDTHWLPHDARTKTLASNKSVIEQLSDRIPLKYFKIVPSLSVQDGIQATRLALKRMWFDHKCEEGIECLRQYQREWDDDKRCFRDKPRHDWTSHGADAMRMAAIAWSEAIKAIPKDDGIKGLTIGRNDVSLDELWSTVQRTDNRRI
jgi:phage terminase large subunit